MRCSQCGQWNRPSFPFCATCGAPLEQTQQAARSREKQDSFHLTDAQIAQPVAKAKNDRAEVIRDLRDVRAQEQEDLEARQGSGTEVWQKVQQININRDRIYSKYNVGVEQGTYRRRMQYVRSTIEVELPPNAEEIKSSRLEYDEYGNAYLKDPNVYRETSLPKYRSRKKDASFGVKRVLRYVVWVLLFAAALTAAYIFVIEPYLVQQQQPSLQERSIITPSIMNDMPAHLIRIPGEEGANIYIKELKKSYIVAGGYASIEVPDYSWYEDKENLTEEVITATLTPFVKTSAGEQKPMEIIRFDVEVPLSPLIILTPETGWDEVSTKQYNLEFEVAENSTVYINDDDLSDLVNTQSGQISYNATITPTGDNVFIIRTRAQYCRENSAVVTIYRETQEILLDLPADIASRYSPNLVEDTSQPKDSNGNYPKVEDPMTIKCSTVTWATIEIKSPYANLDLSRLAIDGTFTFQPVFETIGTNTIIIEASAPGYKTSVVKHDVYYVPIATIYTRKAWDMNDNYSDFLNHSQTRIANTQVYVCKGTITQIISTKPQLAIMKLNSTYDRSVLIENLSNDTWVVGESYRIYADAYGLYDGMPRLIGRYTYPPLK